MSSELQLDVCCRSWCGGDIWWTHTKERQVWCYLQVKLCDPRLSALSVVATIKALYKYTSFLSFPPAVRSKALFSVLYCSSCTPLLWALSSPLFPWSTTFMQMTHIFFSFHSRSFDSSITHLQNAIHQISSFVTANLFTLNCYRPKTAIHRSQKATCQNTKLLTQQHPLCSQPWLCLWWTPHLFWEDLICLQVLLLSYSSSLYPPLSRFQTTLYNYHLHRSLQTRSL